MTRALILTIPLLLTLACAEPTEFTITIDNAAGETVAFDQVYGDPVVALTVQYGGQDREVLDPHGGCYRRCGRLNEQICADMAAPEDGAYLLLDGESLEDGHDGMGWIRDSDAGGECDREITLTGVVQAALSWGFDPYEEDGLDPLDPTESGFVDGADFDPDGTANGEIDLGSETELILLIED